VPGTSPGHDLSADLVAEAAAAAPAAVGLWAHFLHLGVGGGSGFTGTLCQGKHTACRLGIRPETGLKTIRAAGSY
jgi:hypothetical protein